MINWIAGSRYYQAVLNELTELGITVQIFEYEHRSRSQLLRNLVELISIERADCWVLLGAPPEVQKLFASRHLPCLLDGIAIEGLGLPDFEVDFDALYRHAINHLQNNGHQHICLLTSEHSARINPKSIAVFRETMRKRIPDMPDWEPIRTYDGSAEHFKIVLNSLFFGKHPAPTAVVIAMVKRVATAMTWLMKHERRIPDDVSIISRDHDEFLDALHPLPAHYRQPPSAPKRFVRAILAVIEKKHARLHTRIMTEFVPGKTVATFPESEESPRARTKLRPPRKK